jgi:hypothetical protein
VLDITAIENALYQWVVTTITNLDTIFAHQNAPRPGERYALINIVQTTQIGTQESANDVLSDESIDVDYSSLEMIMVSINVYGSSAFQDATTLKNSLWRISTSETLFAAGLGFSDANTINDIPEEINKKWTQRAQFDCFFTARSLDEENIASVRNIEIQNLIDGSDPVIISTNIVPVDITAGEPVVSSPGTRFFGFFEDPAAFGFGDPSDTSLGGNFAE